MRITLILIMSFLLTNCSNEISILDIYKVDGSVCKNGDCFIVSKDCHNVLYPREK